HYSQLLVEPEPRALEHQNDFFGNPIALFTIQEPHRNLSITVKHRIEVKASAPINLQDSPGWQEARTALTTQRLDALPYTFDSIYVPQSADLATYAAPSF